MKRYKWLYSALLMTLCYGGHAQNSGERMHSWTQGAYLGPIDVSLKIPKGIHARIETDDLILHSVNWNHYEDYVQLFSDPASIEKYADGKTWTMEEIRGQMQVWIKRWENRDPFSAFAVFIKGEKKQFIGHIVLGHGPHPGQAELALLFKPEFVSLGYCKQATAALLYGYIPRLLKDNYLVNLGSEPAPLALVHAIVRLDNPYVAQALRRAGMKFGEAEKIWGAQRVHYTITTEEILNNKTLRDKSVVEAQ